MCTQPTYFRTLCEWTLCNRPHSASHPRLGGIQSAEGYGPSPVCVDIYVSKTDERARRDPLPPQTNGEKALQQNPQNVDGERPREEEREETCCSSHHTDSQPTEWAAAGIQNPTRGGKEEQMHPKEQNDAVNCCDFFLFFIRKLSACSLAANAELASNIC